MTIRELRFLFFLPLAFLFFQPVEAKAPLVRKYNLTASESHRFVWFRIAKVGTTTFYKIFRDNQVVFAVNKFEFPYDPKNYKGHFKFGFVRNPWDRVVSCYCNKILNKCWEPFRECYDKDFDYFVDFIDRHNLAHADRHIRLQTRMIPYKEVNFIGRFETFARDLKYVLKVIGLKNVEIPKKNSTRHEHYSKYYTQRTKQIIARKYKDDIAAFG